MPEVRPRRVTGDRADGGADNVYEGVAGVVPYSAPHRGAVLAFDRHTGGLAWWYPVPRPDPAPQERTAYGFPGSVAVGGGMVYAGDLSGKLHAFMQ